MGDTGTADFVGRQGELRVLDDALNRARRGQPAIVLVEGSAGVGKTALVRRFLSGSTNVRSLWASGDEGEIGLEFGVIEQLWAALPPSVTETRTAASGVDSLAVGADLLATIGMLEQQAPVVLVVDDLHWADAASARALLFAVRRLRRDEILVVLAARPDALGRFGDGWRRTLADGELTRLIQVGGLDSVEVGELAAAHGQALVPHDGERLRAHTAGNPLYISELLAELPAGALQSGALELPAPRSYASSVLTRVGRLSPSAQSLVAAAAVLGGRPPLRVAALICAADNPLAAAEEAAGAGLLLITDGPSGTEIGFVHPLMRVATYDNLSGPQRRALHRAAAGLFESPSSFRHRVAATGGVDARLAAQLRAAAAHELADGALSSAAKYLALACRVEPDPTAADLCLYRAVEILLVAGEVHAADAYAEQVRARPASAYRRYVTALLNTPNGGLDWAVTELRAVIEQTSPDADPDLYARAASALAYLYATLGDDEQTIAWARRARTVPDRAMIADSLTRQALAWSYARLGRFSQSLAMLVNLAPENARPMAFETELRAVRGVVRNWSGDLPGALADLHAVEGWVRNGHPVTDISLVYASLAEAEFRSGAWDAAATHIELALSLAEDLDYGWYLSYTHSVAAHLYAARGADGYATVHADAARRTAGAGPVAEGLAYAALAEAHRAWALRDWPAVSVALRPLHEAIGKSAADYPNLVLWRYRLAEAWIGQDKVGEALGLLDQAPRAPWGGAHRADRVRLYALALQRRGDRTAARDAFAAEMAHMQDTPATFAEALLALDFGRLLIETGQFAAAATPLRAAREKLHLLGATRLQDACDVALRTCGADSDGVPHAAPRLDALTPREQVVARLVANGATNREVAADLYLSVKGVEYHLGNIFPKLGITSRRQLRSVVDNRSQPNP
ncbi:regulatory LuxR family protein [Antricoccus suffuscus]|uniref:Regulatory LuxR family protein n=1 Tax=Antricoccus suffuscus TaxID=1629062 RepID=A0A2T1A077_9ACTN|nr:LuxR family transcriptional regulator [Antricoccus suffuscus]PRZ42000.1 regulatory LuxR family protein [Antricoccus suffuscus]